MKSLILYEPPLYAREIISFPLLKTFVKINILKTVGRPQAAAENFRRMV